MRTLRISATTVRRLREALLDEDEQERFAFVYAGDEGDLLANRVVPVDDDAMARQSRTACRPAPEVERERVSECYDQQLAPVLAHSHPFSETPRFSSTDVESMGRFREWLSGLFPDHSFGFAVVGTSGIEAVADAGTRLDAVEVEVVGEWKLDTPVAGARSRFRVESGDHGGSTPDHRRDTSPVDRRRDGSTPDERTDGSPADTHSDGSTPDRRYDRTVRALGLDGQRRLESATVGVVGVGGLGSMVAEQLARLGVDELVLVDPDEVEASNLSRLVGVYDHHVGQPKVTAVREHLWKSSGGSLTVEAVPERVQDCAGVLDRCDVVIGCVDSVTARSYCNEYAVKHLTYYLDAGVRIDTPDAPAATNDPAGDVPDRGADGPTGDSMVAGARTDDRTVELTGYVHLVAPGSNACFDCLGRHDQAAARIEQLSPTERSAEQERGYIDDDELAPEPAVIHLNGQCASKAVSVLVNLVTGVHTPPDFIRYEDHDHEMTELTTEPSENCPTCGTDGVLGVGRRSFGDAHFQPDEEPAASD